MAELEQLGGTGVPAEPTTDREFAVLALTRSSDRTGPRWGDDEVSCIDDLR